MNILPLILTFIMVFTLSASLFMDEKRSTFAEGKNYISYMQTERRLKNRLEAKLFSKEAAPSKKEPQEKEEKPKNLNPIDYKSRRVGAHLSAMAKINIAPLFDTPSLKEYSLIYETAAKLIKNLYSTQTFYKEKLEYQLLDILIAAGKEKKEAHSINELFLEVKELQPIFYKILKGTLHYNTQTKEGCPPLEDFILIDSQTKAKPIAFCFASIPLLEALFGSEITNEILAKEEGKWAKDHKHHTVTKEELSTLLQSLKQSPSELLELLNFSRKASPKKELTHTDPKTKICIKKPL